HLAYTTLLRSQLQIVLYSAYTDARVKKDYEPTVIPQPGFDVILNTGLAGDRMPYSPKLAWSATAEYQFDLAAGIQGQVGGVLRWVDERVSDTTERQRITAPGDPSTILQEVLTPPVELDSYSVVDLYAGIEKGAWSVRTFLRNVTDERAWSSVSPAASALTGAVAHINAVPIQPRTFGLEFDYRF